MALRRSIAPEPRIELIPLIDVLMFMLTFFLVTMAVAVRVEMMPMSLRPYMSGEATTPRPAATISIDLAGGVFLDREPTSAEGAVDQVRELAKEKADLAVYLAVAEGDGTVDRAPILQDLLDRLKDANVSVSLVGRPRPDAGVTGGVNETATDRTSEAAGP